MKVETEPYSVLIADDDDSCREALRDIVEQRGFRTLLASSGEEALDIVHHQPIHLALMDMHMPSMSGLEALRLMQRQFQVMLPCILVTADASASLLRQACQEQVYSVIHKPVSKGVVLHTIVRAMIRFYGEQPPSADASSSN